MKIKFWGTRGSIPAPLSAADVQDKIIKALILAKDRNLNSDKAIKEFVKNELPFSVKGFYGSNTSCVEIADSAEDIIICDAGSGIRNLGQELVKKYKGKKLPKVHIFISHLHWDHINGFPFFAPVYMPDTQINIYGFHNGIEAAFRKQQDPVFFPVPFDGLKAKIKFHKLDINSDNKAAGFIIKGIKQNHPGVSYGYSFEKKNKKVVYSTDAEHKKEMDRENYPFIEFFKNADALIFDAQFVFLEGINEKEDWGHSSNIVGVELAIRAGVKNLILFHTEPMDKDSTLDDTLKKTLKYSNRHSMPNKLGINIAYDGLVFKV
jgi:phosphoribosyl 1,2-cyclic phosphodiesterase